MELAPDQMFVPGPVKKLLVPMSEWKPVPKTISELVEAALNSQVPASQCHLIHIVEKRRVPSSRTTPLFSTSKGPEAEPRT